MTIESINLFWDILENASLDEEAQIIVRNILKVHSVNELDRRDITIPQEGEENAKISLEEGKDYRVSSVVFHDFRTFPEYEDKPFGIDFEGKYKQPCSLFLLGSNGTGKSTIFTALEKFYTGKSSLAKERVVKEDRYLTYAFRDENVYQLSNHLDIKLAGHQEQEMGTIATSASFCSSYDIQLLEQSHKGLTDFIFSQLGYEDVLEVYEMLGKRTRELRKEILDLEYADDEVDIPSKDWHSVIDEYVKVVLDKKINVDAERRYANKDVVRTTAQLLHDSSSFNLLFADDWNNLVRSSALSQSNVPLAGVVTERIEDAHRKQQENQINKLAILYQLFFYYYDHNDTKENPTAVLDLLYKKFADAQRIESKYLASKEETQKEKLILSRILKSVMEVKRAIDEREGEIVHEFIDDFNSFVKSVLGEFSEKNEEFTLSFDDQGKCEVKIKVKPENGDPFETTPREYLNSFRFILYCVVLKFSLALCQMRKKKISAPIVIDDIFDASDFENSLKLERFVYLVFKTYRKYVKEEGVDVPLQLILLTHDEMMKSAFERGLCMLEMEDMNASEEYICGRLIPYRYARKDSERGMTQIADKKDFYNLYIPL